MYPRKAVYNTMRQLTIIGLALKFQSVLWNPHICILSLSVSEFMDKLKATEVVLQYIYITFQIFCITKNITSARLYSRKIIAVLLDKICLLNVLLRPITKLTWKILKYKAKINNIEFLFSITWLNLIPLIKTFIL